MVDQLAESSGQLPVNSNLKERKTSLYGCLGHVLAVSLKKFDKETASNSDRQSWGRLVVNAVQAYGKLLESAELEELAERLERLERVVEVNKRNGV